MFNYQKKREKCMIETTFKAIFIGIIFFIAFKLIFNKSKGLTIFEIHFKNGKLDRHKGKIPDRFERECKAIAKNNKLTGTIRAEKSGSVRLHVSANVTDDIAQQIRNMFPFELYDLKSPDNSKLKG